MNQQFYFWVKIQGIEIKVSKNYLPSYIFCSLFSIVKIQKQF